MTGVAGGDDQTAIARKTGVDQSSVSRWKTSGRPGNVDNVAKLARGYGHPVLEAFVAAGFLTSAEAGERPSAAPDFSQLKNDELLELVRARMREEGEGVGDAAANSGDDSGDEMDGLRAIDSSPQSSPPTYEVPDTAAARRNKKRPPKGPRPQGGD